MAVSGIMRKDERYRFNHDMSGNDGPEVEVCAPGAMAMWLGQHGKKLNGWSRIENARRALLLSAAKRGPQPYSPVAGQAPRTRNDWFGDGCIDCSKALSVAPVPSSSLTKQPEADARFAVLQLVLGDDIGGLLL